MSYKVGQFRFSPNNDKSSPLTNCIYTNCTASNKTIEISGVNVNTQILTYSNFQKSNCYYLRALIKQNSNYPQNFSIYLNDEANGETQYLSSITVESNIDSNNVKYTELEIVFENTLSNATYISFNPKVTIDFLKDTTETCIIYEDLSLVNNLYSDSHNAIKIGLQAHPGFLACVNKEPILIGRRGVYELRDKKLLINFVSYIPTCKNKNTDIPSGVTTSIINTTKREYNTENFIIDYMYEEDSD